MDQTKNPLHHGLKLWETRQDFPRTYPVDKIVKGEDEGGCGVTGFAASVPVSGKHIFLPSVQMHNRGNGKGGGIAAVGRDADSLGVSQEVLEEDYLHPGGLSRPRGPAPGGKPVHHQRLQGGASGQDPPWSGTGGISPASRSNPRMSRYFVRVKPEVLQHFVQRHRLLRNPPAPGGRRVRRPEPLQAEPGLLRLFGGRKRPLSCSRAGTS